MKVFVSAFIFHGKGVGVGDVGVGVDVDTVGGGWMVREGWVARGRVDGE